MIVRLNCQYLKLLHAFELNTSVCHNAGGLLTAVDKNICSALVSNTKSEILVVQTKMDDLNLRIINAYGPQESDTDKDNIFQFWQDLEKEIIWAKEQNCKILIQMDANAKVGSDVITNDPNKLSCNGDLLLELISRQNLAILNANALCQGVINYPTQKNHFW